MLIRCPVCKAENTQGPQCRRCKADLSLLFQLEQQRDALLAAAAFCLRNAHADEALRLALEAHRLRRGVDSCRLLAVAHLLRREFAPAWHYGQCAQE